MAACDAFRLRLVDALGNFRAVSIAAAVLVTCFVLQGVWFIRANAPTYDEAMHLAAGYSYLATGDFRLEPQNPPLIKAWLALPVRLIYRLPFSPNPQHWRDGSDYLIGQDFLYGSTVSADRLLLAARLANLLLGIGLILLIGRWAWRLWGNGAALLAIALAAFEPNFVAHASLVTTDIGAGLFILLTLYLLWEYFDLRDRRLLIGVGLALGAALVSKFSTVILLPIVGILILTAPLFDPTLTFFARAQENRLAHRLADAAAALLLVWVCAALVIPTAYFFHGFEPWSSGLQRFASLARAGQPAFFLGQYSYQGWWSYYLVAFLIKTPLATLLLIGASLALYQNGERLAARAAIFLLLPVLVILLATTQASVNIGLRHILPVYPFLFVLASRLATIPSPRRWLAPALIAGALSFTMISSLRIAPHQLAYFNEIIGGPSHGYRYLADSNLDWGQDLKNLKAYMDREKLPIVYLSYFGSAPPAYYGIRYQYVPGTWPLEWPPPADKVPAETRKVLAISVNNLQDIFNPYAPLFPWLRLRRPIAAVGYSILIYDLTNDAVGLMMVERTYATTGLKQAVAVNLGMN